MILLLLAGCYMFFILEGEMFKYIIIPYSFSLMIAFYFILRRCDNCGNIQGVKFIGVLIVLPLGICLHCGKCYVCKEDTQDKG